MDNNKLSFKQIILVASMLFGMFFGAGNLIFPVHLGQLAGSNWIEAFLGFALTGVGLPLLGIIALARSQASGLQAMANRVGKGYSYFFTTALCLVIGPCFAIPRCATTAFTIGIEPIAGSDPIALLATSAIFFGIVLFLALNPKGILTWIGKIINPVFLIILIALIIIAIVNPISVPGTVAPDPSYAEGSFFSGLLEGYNTMDALAALIFGIVVIDVIRQQGIRHSNVVAGYAAKSGIFTFIAMIVIYLGVTYLGVTSRGMFGISENGGIALSEISGYYLGNVGKYFLAVMVILAVLKTAIGLVQSIARTFAKMFTNQKGYTWWAVGFTAFAFIVSNAGLSAIITYAVPVLVFLYPLAITLILLSIFGKYFQEDRTVYVCTTVFTIVAAAFDLFAALGVTVIADLGNKILPMFSTGLGFVVPAAAGCVIGLIIHFVRKKLPSDRKNPSLKA